MSTEVQMQEFVSALTDAVVQGRGSVDQIVGRYDMHDEDVMMWLPLIEELNQTLVEVQPSERYRRQLRKELLTGQPVNVGLRLRRLPARVQLAAVLTLIGGFLLIARNRFVGDVDKVTLNSKDEAALLH
ncbi:hypothetical protein G4Y79_10305 [Phototrophicus methaneseepsis]|uniref:Uncharacterized protein n=1 Tax=Phototrophicus methaneseepsis TaxID=2710758 RepID=A0A7S8ED35_9CHLR|nr:hypothetical protein [Phototrophicus methaneseepsis]QPC84745.1 hypothetical protein G4Y79_10305 [Phototrophicus methaneseepsis]